MKLLITLLFLYFTCSGATSVGSGHLDFMSGSKKDNILHLKDIHTEIKDFAEAFKDVARSEEKIKTTFRILNRPNDSRFKLDLMLIISQMEIMDNESQSFENKQNAWAVLQPLLEKYDKNFTYPADYDVMSGEYVEIILDDWLDRYTQEKVVRRASGQEVEGSGSSEEEDRNARGEESVIPDSLNDPSDHEDVTESKVIEYLYGETEGDASTEAELSEEGLLHYVTTDDQSEDSTEGYSTEESEAEVTEGFDLHSTVEESEVTDGYDLHSTGEESEATEGYELHYTTTEEESSPETEGYEISTDSDEAMETSTEYQLVGTTEDGQAVIQSTTEYYIPTPEEHEVVDLIAEDSEEVAEEEEGSMAFEHRSGFIFVDNVDKKPLQAGSVRGIPGVHFPDYDEIPITSFSCADKKYIPGFYADLETGCQVFHVCWPHRRESFLCPIGTLFNQALLSCDYWYSTNCSLSPLYYDVNKQIHHPTTTTTTTPFPSTHKPQPKIYKPEPKIHKPQPKIHIKATPEPPVTPTPSLADVDWVRVLGLLPAKSKVVIYPQSSKTSPAKDKKDKDSHFVKTEEGVALKKAIATEIIGKILKAGETLAKTAVHSLPVKYATKKPVQVHSTSKPGKVHPTAKPGKIYISTTAKPGKIHISTTAKPGKVHISTTKAPPKINPRFVVKPSAKKFETLKPILVRKPTPAPKVDKQQAMQKVKLAKKHIPDILLGAMEMAGTVLQKDILPLTRMALVESSLKHSKSKKH